MLAPNDPDKPWICWEAYYKPRIWRNDYDTDIQDEPIVYKLFDGNELVYVGCTCAGLRRRLRWHKDTKTYDPNNVHVLFCDTANEMEWLEKMLVRTYQPRYNDVRYSTSFKFPNLPKIRRK